MTTLAKTPRSGLKGNTKPLDQRSRAYCFTINNYTDDDWSRCQHMGDYGCIAKEVGESGTPHIQGYFYFKNKKSFNKLKKEFPKAHFEIANGNSNQNRTYIFGNYTKGDKHKPLNSSAIEWGEIPSQGERIDLNEIKQLIIDGKKVDDIAIENPIIYHQYGRTLSKIEDIMLRKKFRTEMTKGIWYWGKTGVGKSKIAFEGYTPETHYVLNIQDGGWWEGYAQQETVIINEFRGEIKFNELLDLCDRYPKTVKRRCREPMPFTSKKIIITSALPPEEIYKNSLNINDKLEQFTRRFEIINLR